MIKLAQQREELRIVNDQHGCPTAAQAIAAALLAIAASMNPQDDENRAVNWGTYHYSGEPATTWFDFAKAIIDATQQRFDYKVKNILPIPTREFPTPATRPQHSVMDCSKIRDELGIQPQSWQNGLEQMFAHDAFMSYVAG
jgi:dTDP-4-dehydrorhamnose reductase